MILRDWIFSIVIFLIGSAFSFQAPGTIKMKISHTLKYTELDCKATLESEIKSDDIILYHNKDQMRKSPDNEEVMEITIEFPITNVSQQMLYTGSLTIDGGHEPISSHIFSPKLLQYNIKHSGGHKARPDTIYSSNLKKELHIILSVKCKRNYYPENNCSVFCIKTPNTKYCDSNGNKICQKGFYFHSEKRTCENDWCFMANSGCKNNGKCMNREKNFVCICSLNYKGHFCEIRRDLCETYVCHNGTRCVLKSERISCQTISTQSEPIVNSSPTTMKFISVQTLIMMVGFFILLVITIGVTIWACRTPKKKFRSMETSINSGATYYPNNSISKFSNHCSQNDYGHHQCSCMGRPVLDRNNYLSLKNPSNRTIQPWNRAYSDLMISTTGRNPSLTSTFIDDGNFPLPLPINEENNGDYCGEI